MVEAWRGGNGAADGASPTAARTTARTCRWTDRPCAATSPSSSRAAAASRRTSSPPTNVTATTVILIAHDGEWTRRAAGSREAAFELARSLEVPVYDVNKTGYPNRMREWNSRQRGKA